MLFWLWLRSLLLVLLLLVLLLLVLSLLILVLFFPRRCQQLNCFEQKSERQILVFPGGCKIDRLGFEFPDGRPDVIEY